MDNKKTNKGEIVQQLAEQCGLPPGDANRLISTIINILGEALSQGHPVRLTGLGKIEPYVVKARTGRNPRTGEPLQIPTTQRFRFKPSPRFLVKMALADARKMQILD